MWETALAAGASGILGYVGQQETNAMNRDLTNATNAQNMAEAERNRQFQREMSGTSHQREVEDLKKAGLNPLLSANGGASSPSGSTGQASAAQMANPYSHFSGVMSTAMQTLQTLGNLKKQDAEVENLKMNTAVQGKGIPEADIKNKLYDKLGRPLLKMLDQGIQTEAKKVKNPPKNNKSSWQGFKNDMSNFIP